MKKHLYINGDWKSVNTYKPLYAPYSEETLAEIAQGTEEDVKEAVTAAKNAMKEMNTLSANSSLLSSIFCATFSKIVARSYA
ncbi:aldehyde dehydrogenase family protein, partial [Bacillus sp. D-CC]